MSRPDCLASILVGCGLQLLIQYEINSQIGSASRAKQCIIRILYPLLGTLEHAQGNVAMDSSYVGSILSQTQGPRLLSTSIDHLFEHNEWVSRLLTHVFFQVVPQKLAILREHIKNIQEENPQERRQAGCEQSRKSADQFYPSLG